MSSSPQDGVPVNRPLSPRQRRVLALLTLGELVLDMKDAINGKLALERAMTDTLADPASAHAHPIALQADIEIPRDTRDEVLRLALAGLDELLPEGGARTCFAISGDVAGWNVPLREPDLPDDPIVLRTCVGGWGGRVEMAVAFEAAPSAVGSRRVLVSALLRLVDAPERPSQGTAEQIAAEVKKGFSGRLDWLADQGRLGRVLDAAPPIDREDPGASAAMAMADYLERYREAARALRDPLLPTDGDRRDVDRSLEAIGAAPTDCRLEGKRRPPVLPLSASIEDEGARRQAQSSEILEEFRVRASQELRDLRDRTDRWSKIDKTLLIRIARDGQADPDEVAEELGVTRKEARRHYGEIMRRLGADLAG